MSALVVELTAGEVFKELLDAIKGTEGVHDGRGVDVDINTVAAVEGTASAIKDDTDVGIAGGAKNMGTVFLLFLLFLLYWFGTAATEDTDTASKST